MELGPGAARSMAGGTPECPLSLLRLGGGPPTGRGQLVEERLLGTEDEVDNGADAGVAAVPDAGGPQLFAECYRQYHRIAKVERFQFGEEDVEVPQLNAAENFVGVGFGLGQHSFTVGVAVAGAMEDLAKSC